ncbi:hypothetical protein LT85_0978 [Collimonas arenae]|uniref:HTH cro/C1-type domain-containing protein n=1 Tax=Collimonas arenae TaxID=279058 RepID=A0A0A1F6H5_9BURK|nr:helix-turn-helix transcriptional regulator [Collimonas arenae]AIY40136.1 hypothetical protein LT85_0978 [Collimonas arenae]
MNNLDADSEIDIEDAHDIEEIQDTESCRRWLTSKAIADFSGQKAREFIVGRPLDETLRIRLINARRLNNLEQIAAAKLLGYQNSSALSKMESGYSPISRKAIVRAALAYGVSSDYLMGLSDEPERDPKIAEQMAIIRTVRAQILQQSQSLASILLKNASDMTPMEGHLTALLAQAKRVVEAFDTSCRQNKHFQNDILGGANLQRAIDDVQATLMTTRKFLNRRADLMLARAAAHETSLQGVTMASA